MNLLSSLLPYVLIYKYYAIFIITFLGALALPLPSGSVLMAAAAFSVQGYLNWWLVWVIGLLGNILGDSAGYWLVRLYGMKVLAKLRLARFFKPQTMLAVRHRLEQHPIITIYFSRFMTAIAPAVNVVSGITEMPYRKFLFFESLGELTEVSVWCVSGYIFGANWEYFNQYSSKLWIVIVAGVLISFMVGRVIFKEKVS